MQIRLNKDEYFEMIECLEEGLNKTKINDYLSKLSKEVDKSNNVEIDEDVIPRINAIENILGKLSHEVQLIKDSYLYTYVKKVNLDYIDVMELKKFIVTKENDDRYIIYYLDKFPKKTKLEFGRTKGFGSAMAYKIHEYLDENNLYPKPNLRGVNIVFETIYDTNFNAKKLDNDNCSIDYINAAINATQYSGLVFDDSALNLFYSVKSSVKDIKKELNNNDYNGDVITKIIVEKL